MPCLVLRAHMPRTFKTPGTGQPLVAGDGNNVLVIDAATRAELVALRREALDAMALKLGAPNGAPSRDPLVGPRAAIYFH
jgi:hypothetical protein